jgi:pimeloyl-ACP methyl ester carboxylesterase
MHAPRDRFLEANRLRLHLLEWGEGERVVLLLHGFLEHAHAWDLVAPRLAEAGLHVFALDWRGMGDSAWVGAGGYYHFLDYVADLAMLVPQLGDRVAVVGHSMGGHAGLLYSGTEPERVWAFASIEGLGVPDTDPHHVPQRVLGWIEDLRRQPQRRRNDVAVDTAVERMRERYPALPVAAAQHLVLHNTDLVDGERRWKFDPLHQTGAPQPTYVAQARAFWGRVACPALYVEGGESVLRLGLADLDERLAALRARRTVIAGAGHHPHLEQPEALANILIAFLTAAARETIEF